VDVSHEHGRALVVQHAERGGAHFFFGAQPAGTRLGEERVVRRGPPQQERQPRCHLEGRRPGPAAAWIRRRDIERLPKLGAVKNFRRLQRHFERHPHAAREVAAELRPPDEQRFEIFEIPRFERPSEKPWQHDLDESRLAGRFSVGFEVTTERR
jgi:hypothetical protein